MDQQKNLIIAIAASLAILLGFQFLYEAPRQQARQAEQAAATPQGAVPQGAVPPAPGQPAGSAPPVAAPPAVGITREAALAASPRIRFEAPLVHGTISLKGGRIDDLTLKKHRVSVEPDAPEVRLLEPVGARDAYFGDFGWVAAAGQEIALPGPDTLWTADRAELTPGQPVVLSWDNGQGLRFERRYAVDERYMFTVTQRVVSTGDAGAILLPYAAATRVGKPPTQDFFILHEGFIGVLNGELVDPSYDTIEEKRREGPTTGGWLGITDKYWLVALVPTQDEPVSTRMWHARDGGGVGRYQIDYLGVARTLAAGGAIESTHRMFVGAKEIDALRHYEEQDKILRFDYAIDWGWFYFLTRPFADALNWIRGLVGNFGVAILILTVLIKALFFPLANRSYVMMSKMKALAPKMQELKERCGDNRERLQQEMMRLYKEEKLNPVSGCLPILLQIPVFFALYKVLFVTIEMRHAPFFGWIQDLSATDPTTIANLFGLIPWDPPSFLHLGAWPLIMGVTMWLQMKMNPTPTDPIQAKVFAFMPVIFTVMLASFPSGLVIYWAWNNLLTIAQQYVIMRRMGVKIGT